MNYSKKNIIIDCDPGIDDAFALAFAMSRPEFNILGITTVAGNAPLSTTYGNAVRIAELMERSDITVFAGCDKPLERSLAFEDYIDIHGSNGLGGVDLTDPKLKPSNEKAEDYIISTLLSHESGTITLVTLGPLTNLAAAIKKNPEAVARAKEIYSMGGAILYGNITPVAEFNYWADPEAAKIVFESNIPIYMVGLNVTEQVRLTDKHAQLMKQHGNNSVIALADMMPVILDYCNRYEEVNSAAMHDLTAVIACLQPELLDWTHCTVQISTTKVTRGECIADIVDAWKKPKNCYVATSVKSQEILELFFRTMLPGINADVR